MTARPRIARLRAPAVLVAALLALLAGLYGAAPGSGRTNRPAAREATTVTTTATATTSLTSTVTTTATRTTTTASAPSPPARRRPRPRPRPARIPPLTGSLGAGATFPERTLVLSAPSLPALDPGRVALRENGAPVRGLKVEPLTEAVAGEFGVVLVIDQSPSMAGRPLVQAMAAARALAAKRTGAQELAVITFDDTATVALALTSDPRRIDAVLRVTPPVGAGTRILPALMLALEQLSQARVAAGGVILLSDGGDWERGTTLTPEAVGAAAKSIGVPIYTVGLKDRYYSPASLRSLAGLGGGRFAGVSGEELPKVFAEIESALRHRFLVRYRSDARRGEMVAVQARVDGIPGSVRVSYRAPEPAPITRRDPRPAPRPIHVIDSGMLPAAAGMQPLSQWPSFAPAPAQRGSYWTSTRWVLPVAVTAGLLIGLAMVLLIRRLPHRRELQVRVAQFTEPAADAAASSPGAMGVAPQAHSKFLERRRWWPRFTQDVDVGRVRTPPVPLVRRWAVGATTVAFAVGLGSGMWWLAALVIALWPSMMRAFVRRQARRQRMRFVDQLPSYLQDLAGAMRAGRSVAGAFAAVADSSDEPIRGEFERLVADEQLGRPLEESLETIARRMRSDDIDQVALITSLHRRSGSNVAESLDRVAEGSRDRADMRREIRALTGQARMSSYVLTSLPPALLVGISVIAPKYAHPLFHTTGGFVLLGFAALLVLSGWAVMRRIVDVEV